jgi:hypothetical protein
MKYYFEEKESFKIKNYNSNIESFILYYEYFIEEEN